MATSPERADSSVVEIVKIIVAFFDAIRRICAYTPAHIIRSIQQCKLKRMVPEQHDARREVVPSCRAQPLTHRSTFSPPSSSDVIIIYYMHAL